MYSQARGKADRVKVEDMKKKKAHLQLTPEEEEGITKIQARVCLSSPLQYYKCRHKLTLRIEHDIDGANKLVIVLGTREGRPCQSGGHKEEEGVFAAHPRGGGGGHC
jgi:hypothetical protein